MERSEPPSVGPVAGGGGGWGSDEGEGSLECRLDRLGAFGGGGLATGFLSVSKARRVDVC